jgi:hypothetical protein
MTGEAGQADAGQILERLLADAGLEPGAVVLSDGAPGSPPPPEGRWAVVRAGAQLVVGAVGRGRFAPYEGLWRLSEAVDLAIRLVRTPLREHDGSTTAELEAGTRTGAAILERTDARGGAAGPNELQPGDLLDVIGPETGHHLYALGTPFPARSQPPSDVGAPYFALRVVRALPPTVHEGRAAPWFEQPGGGAMVVLDRPLRWYVDQGFLEPANSSSTPDDGP